MINLDKKFVYRLISKLAARQLVVALQDLNIEAAHPKPSRGNRGALQPVIFFDALDIKTVIKSIRSDSKMLFKRII